MASHHIQSQPARAWPVWIFYTCSFFSASPLVVVVLLSYARHGTLYTVRTWQQHGQNSARPNWPITARPGDPVLVLSTRRLPTHRQPTYIVRTEHHPRTPAAACPCPPYQPTPKAYQAWLATVNSTCSLCLPLRSTPLHSTLFGLSKFSDAMACPTGKRCPSRIT